MRVAVRGSDDALELRWVGGHWFAGDGEPMEVRFFAGDDAYEDNWQGWFEDEGVDKALRLN
jgi:hypothetical protein